MSKTKSTDIRWNLHRASLEFAVHRDTLSKKLAGIQPGSDGLYSTLQIHRALSSDAGIKAAKLRSENAMADLAELRVKRERGEYWPVAEIVAEWSTRVVRIKEVISALDLPMETRAMILKSFAEAIK